MTQVSNWLQAHSGFGGCISPDWLLLLLLQYNPAINTGRSFPTHLYQNEFACKTWVLFFFFLSESSKLLRVCFELWNWKRSQRERKRWKEGERVEKLEGVSRERMTERQKATVAQRDITWLFNNLPLSGAPPQWSPWKCCWASNRSIEEISLLTTAIPKQNRNFLFCLEVVVFSLQGLLGGCMVHW